ncbi:MAG: lasso peptide biosynthesis B2 protein [Erythrobacter sp.]
MARHYAPLAIARGAARALASLAAARAQLYRTTPADILALNASASARTAAMAGALSPEDCAAHCDKVAFFIPRMAARVPWRADCLVQAMAGQRWLMRQGVASEIVIGTAKLVPGEFEAHAWLVCEGRIVLGGDISRFSPLIA